MQGFRKLDVTFTKEMLEKDYKELRSTIKIAKKYGVCKKCILNYMNRFGINRQRKTIPIYKVREMALNGMTAPEIASCLGFTATGISQSARQNNIVVIDRFHKGFITTDSGYILVRNPNHPFCDKKGYVRLHRLIMENYLGRTLDPDELVHHINGNTKDNRIENLELTDNASHIKLHHTGKKGRGPDKKPRKNSKQNPRARGGFAVSAKQT